MNSLRSLGPHLGRELFILSAGRTGPMSKLLIVTLLSVADLDVLGTSTFEPLLLLIVDISVIFGCSGIVLVFTFSFLFSSEPCSSTVETVWASLVSIVVPSSP